MQEEAKNILDEIYDYVGRFIYYPSEAARIAHVAWMAHTYLTKSFYATPRLLILSPEKRSGKTRLIEITKLLVQNGKAMVSPSPSSLYTYIELEEVTPTFLIDEVGRLLERKEISDFISIVEAGFQPGHTVPRVVLDPVRRIEDFKVYAPILLAGIDNGRMPDTILDRSITIRMKRHIGKKLSYRPRKHADEGIALGLKLSEWASRSRDKAAEMEPVMPEELNDRELDKWEPLVVVGRLADLSVTDVTAVTDVTVNSDVTATWEERITKAALELSREDKEIETPSTSETLLKDIYNVFDGQLISVSKMKTVDLCEKLNQLEESPWFSYNYGKPLDGRGLAKMLKRYNIRRKSIRFDNVPEKGYYRSDFEDAWKRYLRVTPETTVTPVTAVTSVTPSMIW